MLHDLRRMLSGNSWTDVYYQMKILTYFCVFALLITVFSGQAVAGRTDLLSDIRRDQFYAWFENTIRCILECSPCNVDECHEPCNVDECHEKVKDTSHLVAVSRIFIPERLKSRLKIKIIEFFWFKSESYESVYIATNNIGTNNELYLKVSKLVSADELWRKCSPFICFYGEHELVNALPHLRLHTKFDEQDVWYARKIWFKEFERQIINGVSVSNQSSPTLDNPLRTVPCLQLHCETEKTNILVSSGLTGSKEKLLSYFFYEILSHRRKKFQGYPYGINFISLCPEEECLNSLKYYFKVDLGYMPQVNFFSFDCGGTENYEICIKKNIKEKALGTLFENYQKGMKVIVITDIFFQEHLKSSLELVTMLQKLYAMADVFDAIMAGSLHPLPITREMAFRVGFRLETRSYLVNKEGENQAGMATVYLLTPLSMKDCIALSMKLSWLRRRGSSIKTIDLAMTSNPLYMIEEIKKRHEMKEADIVDLSWASIPLLTAPFLFLHLKQLCINRIIASGDESWYETMLSFIKSTDFFDVFVRKDSPHKDCVSNLPVYVARKLLEPGIRLNEGVYKKRQISPETKNPENIEEEERSLTPDASSYFSVESEPASIGSSLTSGSTEYFSAESGAFSIGGSQADLPESKTRNMNQAQAWNSYLSEVKKKLLDKKIILRRTIGDGLCLYNALALLLDISPTEIRGRIMHKLALRLSTLPSLQAEGSVATAQEQKVTPDDASSQPGNTDGMSGENQVLSADNESPAVAELLMTEELILEALKNISSGNWGGQLELAFAAIALEKDIILISNAHQSGNPLFQLFSADGAGSIEGDTFPDDVDYDNVLIIVHDGQGHYSAAEVADENELETLEEQNNAVLQHASPPVLTSPHVTLPVIRWMVQDWGKISRRMDPL